MRLTLGLIICDELAAHDALPSPAALDALGQLRHFLCTWEFRLQASASLATSRRIGAGPRWHRGLERSRQSSHGEMEMEIAATLQELPGAFEGYR